MLLLSNYLSYLASMEFKCYCSQIFHYNPALIIKVRESQRKTYFEINIEIIAAKLTGFN